MGYERASPCSHGLLKRGAIVISKAAPIRCVCASLDTPCKIGGLQLNNSPCQGVASRISRRTLPQDEPKRFCTDLAAF